MSDHRVWKRLWNAIAPATITALDDSTGTLRVQVKIGPYQIIDRVFVLQQFGFSSSPPLGSDAAVLFIGGDKSNGVVIGTGNQGTRPRGKAAGDTVVYNHFGMTIALSAAGITINPNGLPVTITGDLRVTGSIVSGYGTGDAIGLQTHRHGTGTSASGTVVPTPGT